MTEGELPPHHAAELAGCFRACATELYGHACFVARGDRARAAQLVQNAFEAAAPAWPVLRGLVEEQRRAWLRTTLAKIAVSGIRREAAFRDAEGRERSAQAEAKATEMVRAAVARGDVSALNSFIAEKYLRAFTELAKSPNQKVLMLPIEAVGVLGALGGIGEIARETFGGGGDGKAPPPPRRPTGPAAGGVAFRTERTEQ